MEFCTNMYLDNLKKPTEYQGYQSVRSQDHVFFAWTSWLGPKKSCTGMARRQYLALSKA